MTSSATSAMARPPGSLNHLSSTKPTFSGGSSRREGTRTGRIPASNARSVARAARLPDRTDANVAAASTSVPAAVPSSATVDSSAIDRSYELGDRSELVLRVEDGEPALVGADHALDRHDRSRVHASKSAPGEEHDGDAARVVDEHDLERRTVGPRTYPQRPHAAAYACP